MSLLTGTREGQVMKERWTSELTVLACLCVCVCVCVCVLAFVCVCLCVAMYYCIDHMVTVVLVCDTHTDFASMQLVDSECQGKPST